MTLQEVQEEIVENFELFDEWMDKYQYLIELSKDLPLIQDDEKKPANLIEGCQSRVWLFAGYDDNVIQFFADSDAIITKGIIALLVKVLNKRSPQEILDADLWFIDRIGLKEHLSPTRANGLVAMIKQLKMYALAFEAKNN